MNQEFLVDTRKTGKGKTTNAIYNLRHDLEKRFNKEFRVVFLLEPYTRLKSQTLKNHRNATIDLSDVFKLNDFDIHTGSIKNKVVVTTYAGICSALRSDQVDIKDCLLIFDEIHRFIQFTTYQQQLGDLLEYIINPDLYDSITAYGLSGTPEILFDYYNKIEKLPFKFVDDTPHDKELTLKANKGVFIRSGSIQTYSQHLIHNGFTGAKFIYVDNAKTAVWLYHTFNQAGYNAAFIVSESNETIDKNTGEYYFDLMNEKLFDGLPITTWIDEKCDIPHDLDVLIVNASCCDGISIYDDENRIDEVIIQSADAMTIRQSRARIRHDVENLTVIFNEQNKNTYLNSLDECIEFSNNIEHIELKDRYIQQQQSESEYKAFITRRNSAIKDEKPFNESKPHVLDCIVHKSNNGYFLNLFIFSMILYECDNYLFRTISNNDEPHEYISRNYNGSLLKTFNQFVSTLNELLIEHQSFRIINGFDMKKTTRNETKITYESALDFLDMRDCETKDFTHSELKSICDSLNLITSSRNRAGVKTLIENLTPYFDIDKKRTKSKRFYRLSKRQG